MSIFGIPITTSFFTALSMLLKLICPNFLCYDSVSCTISKCNVTQSTFLQFREEKYVSSHMSRTSTVKVPSIIRGLNSCESDIALSRLFNFPNHMTSFSSIPIYRIRFMLLTTILYLLLTQFVSL